MKYYSINYPSSVGILKLIASELGLVAILWENENPQRVKLPEFIESTSTSILMKATYQLKEYFLGERMNFHLPLDLQGSDFQKKVWSELCKVSYGNITSYLDIAKKIGQPTASRAVGMAIGKNPISIIVPCHRVIGSNGKLTGFAGGLSVKSFLLNLESQYAALNPRLF